MIRCIDDIVSFIESDDWIMTLLNAISRLNEPDCWLAAGAIRNPIWAKLHAIQFDPKTENDVDVVFFDKANISRSKELLYEKRLKFDVSLARWEVRNQARMHLRNNDDPYSDCFSALQHWAETATAIGARLNSEGVEILAPYGVDDLLNLTIRQTPMFMNKREVYNKRIKDKQWQSKWPLLNII